MIANFVNHNCSCMSDVFPNIKLKLLEQVISWLEAMKNALATLLDVEVIFCRFSLLQWYYFKPMIFSTTCFDIDSL